MPVAMTPYITEERQLNVAQMDVFSRLMVDRIIFLGEPVDDRVATICTGVALSMSAVLLCAGTQGKRAALKHARVMIHQPSGGMQGTAADIDISTRQILKIQQDLYGIIAEHSGQSYERVDEASSRDYWMTAAEARDFGMVDEVLGRR